MFLIVIGLFVVASLVKFADNDKLMPHMGNF